MTRAGPAWTTGGNTGNERSLGRMNVRAGKEMTRHDVLLPPAADPVLLASFVEGVCLADGLTLTLKGALATYPGCTHWHWKRGRGPGILEITLRPSGNRLWVAVHANRAAVWADEAAAQLSERLQRAVGELA